MQRLMEERGLVIQQRTEWGEIFSGFETSNWYNVNDLDGNELFYAAEEGGNFLTRQFLKSLRPFTVRVYDNTRQLLVEVQRPFRFIFQEATVFNGEGVPLGMVRKQWSFLRRRYTVTDTSGMEVCQLFGPLLHPWTFRILQNGMEVGAIRKQWSGIGKEMFTDTDNFGIEFPDDAGPELRSLLLGAVFLIDFCHFEENHNNN
jgi:uncharacterized protein YxjI